MIRRAVVDTNVLVSGLGWTGPPRRIVDLIMSGNLLLITSAALIHELQLVLRYPKLAYHFPEPDELVGLLTNLALVVSPVEQVSVVSDEADNRVLEAAQVGTADAIITGDSQLLRLGAFCSIPIQTAVVFLGRLA